jgi:hypothetical protein
LTKLLALILTHHFEIVFCCGALVGGHEVGDELPAQVPPRGDELVQQIHEPCSCRVLEGHQEPVGHDVLVTVGCLDNDNVELKEFNGVGEAIAASANVRPKLVGPDHAALLASEREASGVVDEFVANLDVLACFTDVIDGAVVVFSAALEGDACIFWSPVDDVVASLTMRRGSCM